MIDTSKLRRAIQQFKFNSRPSSSNNSAPATVGDINDLIDSTAKLFTALVEELEQEN